METVFADKNNSIRTVVPAVYAGLPASLFGANLIEPVGCKEAITQIVESVVFLSAVLMLIIIAAYVRTRLKTKHERMEASNRLYDHHARESDLHPLEAKRLRQILEQEAVPYPQMIFRSVSMFERCIDAEVRRLFMTTSDPDLLEDDEKLLTGMRKKLGYGYLPLEYPLLSTRNVEIGQVMTVSGTTEAVPLCEHAIVTENRETFFRVQCDIGNKESGAFSSGKVVKLDFVRQGDGVYGAEVKICRVNSPSAIDCLHTLDFRRKPLRQYVRIEVDLPIRVRVIPPERAAAPEPFALHVDAKLADISSGGVCFLYEKPFVPGDIVSMRFSLGTDSFSEVSGKVLRVSLQEDASAVRYRHHLQFVSIGQHDRERIMKYIFRQQSRQDRRHSVSLSTTALLRSGSR